MHFDTPDALPTDPQAGPWYRELTRYHWFVFTVAALGWLADCMDQQLFNLARNPAIRELRGTSDDLQWYGGLATMVFMLGWATGGIVFGIMGDRWGRAKTMMLTILLYSVFTGLSALSVTFWDFAFYRFLTGLGVGGEFAVGVALLAEVMPDRVRPHALGFLQACSAIGNVSAAFIGMGLSPLEASGALGEWKPWRYMFIIGAFPALLTLFIRGRLKEPERWQALRRGLLPGQKLGSLKEMFGNPRWRQHAIIGMVLATAGVVGLWGIGFFGFDLARAVFREEFEAKARTGEAVAVDRDFVRLVLLEPEKSDLAQLREGIKPGQLVDLDSRAVFKAVLALADKEQSATVSNVGDQLRNQGSKVTQTELEKEYFTAERSSSTMGELVNSINKRTRGIESQLTWWASMYGLAFNIGAFFGVNAFSLFTHYMGRKLAFGVTFTLALLSTAFAFWNLTHFTDVLWMVPMMGFCQIALFGGYAIYFPELFPTRLRSTGTSFCYNVGRYLAAPGPLLLGTLASSVYGQHGDVESLRYAGVTMCVFFLVGLAVLPWAPETKGKPLPE